MCAASFLCTSERFQHLPAGPNNLSNCCATSPAPTSGHWSPAEPCSGNSSVVKQTLAIIGLVILLRLPFLHQAIQGDDLDYLYGAEHAQIDPLHPLNTHYMFSGDMVDM